MSGMKFQNRAGCRPIAFKRIDDGAIRATRRLSQRLRHPDAPHRECTWSRARPARRCERRRRRYACSRCGAAEQLLDPTRRNGHQRQCFGMSEIVGHVAVPGVIITDTGGTIAVVFAPMKALRRTFYDLRTEGQGRCPRSVRDRRRGCSSAACRFTAFIFCSAGWSAGCSA